MIETEMTEEVRRKGGEKMLERIPTRRFGTPDDVARLVVFLASDDASYLTGQVITLDGGLTVQ
jgi:3-oxoacyl-[acyl-carrier protein] reductase